MSSPVHSRPYPMHTGLVAAADSPATAATNPAGLSRLTSRGFNARLYSFYSDSTWEGTLSETGLFEKNEDSSTTVIPGGFTAIPLNEK